MNQLSLSSRLLLSASFILAAFLSISAFSLNNAFQNSTDKAQQKQLKNTVYNLLAAADFTESGTIAMPAVSAIPELSLPNSGLYAQIVSESELIWQSESLLGQELDFPKVNKELNEHYSIYVNQQGLQFINLSYNIVWENDSGQQFHFTFNVSEDMAMIEREKAGFRRSLWYWLGGTGILLLVVQLIVLRWTLKPLNTAANDLRAIEEGQQNRLSGDYPKELKQLTQNINALLDQEQSRRTRYKNALADLAHSIKTPLAVVQSDLEQGDKNQTNHDSQQQLDRIVGLIDYQLQRAATEGTTTLQSPIDLNEIIEKILSSLDKVYQHKQIKTQFSDGKAIRMQCDEGDIYELFGNLLENAYKYCQGRVEITVQQQEQNIIIRVEDDGPGIPEQEHHNILKRGRRINTSIEGQGIGMAIVSDIIAAYQGHISIAQSHLGGACFIVSLPQR